MKLKRLLILSITLLCMSCSSEVISQTEKQNQDHHVFTVCKDPRPQICSREYNPVCAIKNTGIVCMTTPCPSTEVKTYATGCTACADAKVIKYQQGPCAE